jgi:hypothetical protein
MQCPTCDSVQLVMSERHGIEIDYCPTCRGVWLDRGELDKIIERSAGESGPTRSQAQPSHQPPRGKDDSDHEGHPYQKRRKSWLTELFD